MLQADQIEVDNLLKSLHRIAQNTRFGHQKLLNGDMGVSGTTVGNDLRFDSASPETPPSPKDGYGVDITQVATQAKKKGLEPLTVKNIGGGFKVVINEGGRNAEFETKGKVKEEIDKIVSSYQSDPKRFPKEQMSQDIRTLVLFHLQNAMDDYGVNTVTSGRSRPSR
jgi:flagellin